MNQWVQPPHPFYPQSSRPVQPFKQAMQPPQYVQQAIQSPYTQYVQPAPLQQFPRQPPPSFSSPLGLAQYLASNSGAANTLGGFLRAPAIGNLANIFGGPAAGLALNTVNAIGVQNAAALATQAHKAGLIDLGPREERYREARCRICHRRKMKGP